MTLLALDRCPDCGYGTSLASSRRPDGVRDRVECTSCGWSTEDTNGLLFRLRSAADAYLDALGGGVVRTAEAAVPAELSGGADARIEVPTECATCGDPEVEVGFSWVPGNAEKNGVFVYCDGCGRGFREGADA